MRRRFEVIRKASDMRKYLGLCVALVVCVGCEGKQDAAKGSSESQVAVDDPGHADGHDHDHSQDEGVDHSQAGHSHGQGPHGGVVVDWGGGKYHVEIVFDHAAKSATAYILGADEKTPVPIDVATVELTIKEPAVTLTLTAVSPSSADAGRASEFTGSNEILSTVQDYAGAITGVVSGTPYTGEFKE